MSHIFKIYRDVEESEHFNDLQLDVFKLHIGRLRVDLNCRFLSNYGALYFHAHSVIKFWIKIGRIIFVDIGIFQFGLSNTKFCSFSLFFCYTHQIMVEELEIHTHR